MPTTVIEWLNSKCADLHRGVPLTWRYPRKTPEDPLKATPKASWPELGPSARGPLTKGRKNWFYAVLDFPESHCGVDLEGTEARLYILGRQPFTLWIDGAELYREEHTWMATGPIADPHAFRIRRGRKHRLVLCVEPTQVVDHHDATPVKLLVQFADCADIAVELASAAAQLQLAAALARTGRERQLVENATAAVDLAALKANRWPRVLASIKTMETALTPLSPRAKALTVHLIGHCHIDIDWLWSWKDTVHCVRRDFKSVIDLMDDDLELTFTHSQVPTYDIVRRMDPEVFRRVKAHIREGRWENAAGTWVESDLNLIDGESFARHLSYAADWSRRHLGSKAKVLWMPDTFGHPGNMPQLSRLGGFDCYFHMRCNPGGFNNWALRQWEGYDGTTIPALSVTYSNDLYPQSLARTVLQQLGSGLKHMLHVWGLGDHGGALSREQLGVLNRYRHKPLIPTIRFSTAESFLRAALEETTKWPHNKTETYHLFEGCFTTRGLMKNYNRRCETALLTAETLSALAGLDRRRQLRQAWIPTLFNQFHDTIAGTSVSDTYKVSYRRAEDSLRSAGKVTQQALRLLSRSARRTGGGRILCLFNPSGFERTEPVLVSLPAAAKCLLDSDGRAIPLQHFGRKFVFLAENVPAFSFKSYRVECRVPRGVVFEQPSVSQQEAARERIAAYRIETVHAVAYLSRRSGAIVSYVCKDIAGGCELVGYGLPKCLSHTDATRADLALNVFQLISEAPNPMSAWLINQITREQNLLDKAEVSLVETGPVFARFRVVHRFCQSEIREDVIFYHRSGRVDFECHIDWRERGSPDLGVPQLKVSFAAAMRAARLKTEGPFTIVERPADGQEQVTQKWADLTGDEFGFTLYNDSRYGCDALGSRLRLTLLRNSYSPDPDSDNGRHTVRFAFEAHAPGVSNATLLRKATAYNRPMLGSLSAGKASVGVSGLVIEGTDSLVCTALRQSEYSPGLILRLFETSGRRCNARIRLAHTVRSVKEVNFLENPIAGETRLRGGIIRTAFRPHEVKTLLIESDRRPAGRRR